MGTSEPPTAVQTDHVVLAVVSGLLAYEAYVLLRKEPEATISECVWRASRKTPLVPFLAGVLCGHLFFNHAEAYEDA